MVCYLERELCPDKVLLYCGMISLRTFTRSWDQKRTQFSLIIWSCMVSEDYTPAFLARHSRSRPIPFPPCTNKVKNRHVYLLCHMSKNSPWNKTCDAVIRCEHFVSKAAQTLSLAAPVSTDRRAEFQLSRLARDHNISRCTTAQSLYFTFNTECR